MEFGHDIAKNLVLKSHTREPDNSNTNASPISPLYSNFPKLNDVITPKTLRNSEKLVSKEKVDK